MVRCGYQHLSIHNPNDMTNCLTFWYRSRTSTPLISQPIAVQYPSHPCPVLGACFTKIYLNIIFS
jgi:hypothetical protein